ncbi:uncharacterized protein LOC143297726 isoform X2 [Babylonia areolata]|uniref:uncharacterized protein LOC143297726 isoform X2 n=1 Tax=Babylonia areolata TaxID=304850 RepID=UPI003FD57ED2
MQARDPNTMDSFQDGGQQNTKSERNEYPPMERSHANAEVNNFPNSTGEGTGGPDNFSKLPDGVQPNTVQNYTGYNRSNYGMGDQHGGAMSSSVDYNNQNSQFTGQFSQTPMRSPYPGMAKSSMSPGRPGMMPSGMGIMPGSYNSQRMMSANQSGPTPTLNQLLQTPNPGQRFQGNYGDFSSGQGKGAEMGSGPTYPVPPQGWNGNPRAMGPYPPSSMPGTYRNQGSSLGERSRASGMSPGPGPGYPHQSQYMSSAMAASTPRYMMGQGRPGHMPPMSSHGYSQQMPSHSPMNFSPSMPNQTSQLPNQQQQQQQQQMYHGQQQQPQPPGQPPPQPSPTPSQQPHHSLPTSSSSSSSHRPPSTQGASPKQLSPAPPGMADQNSNHSTSSRKSEENTESNRQENSHGEELKGETCGSEGPPSGGVQSHLGVAGVRPVPSPAGSTGSRSDTPASNSGTQAGSPMPPRPPSSQLEGQGHNSQSPMATQGYSQQMMPPPMGGQMGYPGGAAGGKMGAGPGMSGAQMASHYPQYSAQYPQGAMRGQGVMGSMAGAPGGGSGPMPGNSSYPQAMYNGPGQMGPGSSSMYNNMMNRGMPGYSSPYGPGSGMPMNSHFGSFNSHIGPGQGPGPGPGPGSGPSSAPSASGSVPGGPSAMMPGQMNVAGMGQPAMGMQHGAPMMPGGKGAQAAAQAALMAAASSAGTRMSSRGLAGSPRMMGPQGGGSSPSPGSMTGNLGNPSLNSISNQIQQITSSSVTVPSKPSSPASNTMLPTSSSNGPSTGPPSYVDKTVSSNSMGIPPHSGGAEAAHLMSPMSGSDTQESSRPSSTATPGQTVDAANNTSEVVGSDGSGSMPSSDSTSVDSGFHSTADQSEKAPSESTPTHSSSPSSSNPPPSTNGQCEEGTSQDNDRMKVMGSVSSSIPTSIHSSTTTTTITSASVGSSTHILTTTASSEMLSSGSQTSTSMPMMMSSSTNCNNPPAASIPNGPHYPHAPHPHPGMGYPMGPQGHGAMGASHMMGGPGMHHPGMQQHSMGSMSPYNMPPGSMPPSNMPPSNMPNNIPPSNMPPNNMPNNMPPSNMPNNMPPSNMSSNMPPSNMPNNVPPSNMPPSNMPNNMPPSNMPPGNMPSNMPPNNMPPNNMPSNMPTNNMSNNMPPNNMPSNMPPNNMPPNNMPNNMPPNNMPNNMPPNNMSNSMPPNNMSNSMPPNNMPPNNMPPGSGMSASMPPQGGMSNSMPPGSMMNSMPPHGTMPSSLPPMGMPQSAMPNSMSRGSMANHMPPGSMPGNIAPGNSLASNGKAHSLGPMNLPSQNNTAARASGPPDDPPEKKKKKASDMTKLYDMGMEVDRRPFLDKLLAFLEEKGSPITTMPNISKQPLDLYKLYHCVREKGGFVEVNKAKRWKEICTIVNIGCSASAAFTLKKNYIRYLFSFECKFDLGGVDPAPILAEMETSGDRKREKKRVPSPGSQSSQDAFQQAPGPNNQMMDGGYPGGGGGMPPPFLQGGEGQMMGGGMGPGGQGPPGMMMGGNMMGHPNMMGGHHQGSGPSPMMGHGPNAMMMGSGPSGQSMMGSGMGPQGGMMNSATSMMGPSGMMGPGMHMGSNSYGPSHGMMGPGGPGSGSGMGPSPGPPMAGSSSSSSGGAVSSSPSPLSSTPASSSTGGTMGTASTSSSTSMALPPSTTPNSRPPTADSVSVQDPFADEPGKASSPATFQSRPGQPTPSPTPGGFPSPGPPTTSSTGFGSRPSSTSNPSTSPFPNGPGGEAGPNAFRRSAEGFPPSATGPFPGRPDSAQYPFGQENSSHPGQPFRPSSASSDTSYAPRFPGQQAAFRANGPGEAYGSSHPYAGHASALGPRMPGQEGYGGFPSSQHPGVRPSLNRDGSYSAQGAVWDWNGVGSWGQPLPHPDPFSDYSMSGRDGDRWSPMHSQRSFASSAPGTPSMGPYGRPPGVRGSPQPRDKVLAARLQVEQQQKPCTMLANIPAQAKKEIVFPADSVEATQPTLTKRRRLTHKDICPVEAWRLMMALKSGLLAESTWAIDTLNIMLFDDATVTYFNLSGLPGLLEVLSEQFRATLLHIFPELNRQELHAQGGSLPPCSPVGEEEGPDGEEGGAAGLIDAGSEAQLDKSLYGGDFTWVSRQGRGVVRDQGCGDGAVLDPKKWDKHCSFVSGRRHWQKGGGDITRHVVPCFESSRTGQFLTDMFYQNRTSRREVGRKRKAAVVSDGAMCGKGPKRPCSQDAPSEKQCKEGGVSRPSAGDLCDHSKGCSQQVLHHNSAASLGDIKQEQGSGVHHCQSHDSLPPPLLSGTREGGEVSPEDGVKSSAGDVEESSDKCAPPQLTSEGEEAGVTRTPSQDGVPDKSVGKEAPEKVEPDTSGAAAGPSPKEEEDEMTAEIVAMMIKEQDKEMEEEAYRPDEPPLTTVQSDQEDVGSRCVAISNIFRSLSCIPGNEGLLAKHHGLMWLLGQLLLLHHSHPHRAKPPPAPPLDQQDVVKVEEEVVGKVEVESAKEEEGDKDWATCPEWWWDTLEALRENALVILANICSHMHMRDMANEVCLPILDGLLHWMVCPSSAACDPLPSASSASQLSPQRLVLEALCKLCIHEENVDLVLATPPFSRILLLLERLIRLLAERSQPVPREFSIALLSRLVQGDAVAARAIALQHPSIPLLIEFIESAEQSAMAVAGQHGSGAGVQSNPEALGTSLDMLRRAASTLLHMARLPHNRKLFLHHQSRLLALVMSQWLDCGVTHIISDVLFECSQFNPLPT